MRTVGLATAALALLWVTSAAPLSAQALSGTYTCANGNPGNAYDYGDIGAFFDDLHSYGAAGPVVLEVHDDGGPFVSNASYQLGHDGLTRKAVRGLGYHAPLTIRAAAGKQPEITGSGAIYPYAGGYPGIMSFRSISYCTIEGLTFRDSTYFGILWWGGWLRNNHITIRKCRFYNITQGGAIFFRGCGHHVTIENNICWDCWGGTYASSSWGEPVVNSVIGGWGLGFDWNIRNNTIVHTSGASGSAAFCSTQGGSSTPPQTAAVEVFEGNVIYLSGSVYCWHPYGRLPLTADYNVVYLDNGAQMTSTGGWAAWQAAGYDPNGVNADPLLGPDRELTAGSPAIDLIPASSLTEDINGRPRPMGAGFDAGAAEFPAPFVAVEHNAAIVRNGQTFDAGAIPLTGELCCSRSATSVMAASPLPAVLGSF
jgi:hypothetical protein